MRFISGLFSWAFALIPTAYIGGLIWYFSGVGGNSAEGVVAVGLGPTVIGLIVVGLILTAPLIVRLIRALSGANKVPGARADAVGEPTGETHGFDADAAFANYMRGRDSAPPPPIASDVVEGDLRPFGQRPGDFGRKTV